MTNSPTTSDDLGEAGAYTKTILQRELKEATQEVAEAEDWIRTYTQERDDAQLRVDELNAAIADLDDTRRRSQDLARTIVGGRA